MSISVLLSFGACGGLSLCHADCRSALYMSLAIGRICRTRNEPEKSLSNQGINGGFQRFCVGSLTPITDLPSLVAMHPQLRSHDALYLISTLASSPSCSHTL